MDSPKQESVETLAQLVLDDLTVLSVTLDVVLTQAALDDDVRHAVVRAQARLILVARRVRVSVGFTEG